MIENKTKKGLNKSQVTLYVTWLFLCISMLLVFSQQASTQIYKWVDESGQIHYGDKKSAAESGGSETKNSDSKHAVEEMELKTYQPKPDPDVVLKDVEASASDDSEVIKWSPMGNDKDKSQNHKQKRRGNLVMYATKVCGYCKKARAYFKTNKIRYREIDINANANNRKEFEKQGGQGVPYFVMNNRKKSGFSASSFDQFYFKQ